MTLDRSGLHNRQQVVSEEPANTGMCQTPKDERRGLSYYAVSGTSQFHIHPDVISPKNAVIPNYNILGRVLRLYKTKNEPHSVRNVTELIYPPNGESTEKNPRMEGYFIEHM